MSTEQNKAAVNRLHEAVQKRTWSVLPELFAPNYIMHSTPEVKGPEGVKQMFAGMIGALPDYNETIERMVAEGDLVAVSYTMAGTFKERYGDIAPTGKKFSMPGAIIARFKNGKQVDSWPYGDSLAWYRQLGISPPQG
jgi:predicted ester cyclase